MATDLVQIWNMALGHIKANNFIQAPSDPGSVADQCRLYYPEALQFVLEANDWNFARKTATLALTVVTPTEFAFEYAMPADALTARRIFNSLDPHGNQLEPIKFKTGLNAAGTGKVVWTDQKDAVLIYTVDVDLVTLFSGSFVLCLSFYLASLLAVPVTGDEKKAERVLGSYRLQITQALRQNDIESFTQEDRPADWIEARA